MNPLPITPEIEAAIRHHPNFELAKSQGYCVGNVYDRPKSTLKTSGLPAESKEEAMTQLGDVDRYLWVTYFTAESEPEPLTGGGKEYCFILHPVTLQLLQAHVGGWRS